MDISENYYIALALLFTIIFFTIIFSIVAFVETKRKTKHLFYNKGENLFLIAALSLGIYFGLFSYLNANDIEIYGNPTLFVILSIRVLFAIFVSSQARKLGRSPILWGVLSFFELYAAIIVLYRSHKLLNLKEQAKTKVEELNSKTTKRMSAIKESYKDGIISESDKMKKIPELQDNYEKELDEILSKNNIDVQNDILEKAFKNGVISEDEYLEKKQTIQ